MNNPRIFLWVALALILFVNYETWMRDYATRPAATVAGKAGTSAAAPAELGETLPTAGQTEPAAAAGTAPTAAAATTGAAVAAASGAALPEVGMLTVRTDVLDMQISLRGGELFRADLLQYPLVKNKPDEPVRILRREGPDALYVLQTGLAGSAADQARPTHLATFESDFKRFELQPGMDTLRVPLVWKSADGVTVTKTYTFKRGSYRVDLDYAVQNGSAAEWQAASYAQILHDMPPVARSYFNVSSYAFHGPAIYDGKKYRKLKIDDDEDAKLTQDITGGWIAALQHHFVSALVPPVDQSFHYTLKARGHEYLATVIGPTKAIAAGETGTYKQTLFIGPKLQAQLETTGPELERVADYGHLTFLAKPLFIVLEFVHKIFGNWGVAIILTTFLLKLAFYPLSEASGKSMAKMKHLSPRMKNLQETYKDDREKLGKAMMELYKREKINPAAGCLPIVIQLPVFLAFYWVLLESVEMRQAPFFGWLQDLSSQDPYYILPIIMAGAMFLQYKLQPTPADPVQAKVFMILPLVMSVTFAFFPAGLVLYWVTNTVLSIAQQWNINRRIESRAAAQR
ncbi:MAG TPA: membrane protein insertase YidC [Steroidobacteraceae bacterium]|nr:membrane protein insertase YidC [Steroidobacteraceae bacterium]